MHAWTQSSSDDLLKLFILSEKKQEELPPMQYKFLLENKYN